jgi:dihydroneopterin aldolase
MDVIFIEGLEAITVIGICENELHDPQPVRIDISAGVPRAMACSTDRIGDTIDYSEVRSAVLHLLATHRLQLLEALAEEIAQILLGRFGAHWARVVVVKPNKFEDLRSVGVAIERRRAQTPTAPGTSGDGSVLGRLGAGLVPDA